MAVYTSSTSSVASSSSPVPPPPPPSPNPFVIRWDPHHSPSRSLYIVSVSQDHRNFPRADQLPDSFNAATFPKHAGDSRLRILQFHMGIANRFVQVRKDASTTHAFHNVELWWHQPRDEAKHLSGEVVPGGGGGGNRVIKRLSAQQCLHDLPKGTEYRMEVGAPKYLELVARCAFLIDEGLLAILLDHPNARASFVVYAADDFTIFPLSEVLHFPRPSPLIPALASSAERATMDGYPTAPWFEHRELLRQSIVRVEPGSKDAATRVGAVCTKKYTWSVDDELWLMWMLDVVGVDQVVIAVATRDMNMSVVVDGIARHPGVAERVTLIDLDVPTGKPKVTYSYMLEVMGREAFLRWQADFDYLFLIDPDEFVQLFAPEPPHQRLDVKSFIAHHRTRIRKDGLAYLRRPRIKRSEANKAADPLLAPFLRTLATLNGEQVVRALGPDADYTREFGKSLFWPPRAIHSFLHYNPDTKLQWFPPREAHMLHIREGDAKGTKPGSTRQLNDYLDHFRQLKLDAPTKR